MSFTLLSGVNKPVFPHHTYIPVAQTMREIRGCLFVILGFLGISLSVVISFTFYLLPLAFLIFLGSLVLISYAIGSADKRKTRGPDPD